MKLDPERQRRLNRAMAELETEIMLGMISQEIEEQLGWISAFIHPVTGRAWQIRVDIKPDRY